MRGLVLIACVACTVLAALPAFAQIKQTKEQITFYTSEWKGERFPDGRPKLPDDLLQRAVSTTIEDLQGFLHGQGYNNVFEGGWQALHIEKPFAGRALTAQFMPMRPDMRNAIAAEGKAENRQGNQQGGGTNSWVINELQMGDTMVADGYGKVFQGTLIGSNLGSAIAAHTHNGFIFDAGIRDREENSEIKNLNGFYRGYDPSAWAEMQLTGINVPVRIGHVTVLPGDLILAKQDGMVVIPAHLAAAAISQAEFTQLEDAYNFELNRSGANGGQFEGGWTAEKYAGLGKWVEAHPDKLKMTRAEFSGLLADAIKRAQTPRGRPGARPAGPPNP
jgi:regulator of RNase E activity RraA